MKIIKRGVVPEEREMTGTCNNCSTIIECLAGEAKHHHDQRDGDYSLIICPVCNKEIYLKFM